MQNIMKLQFLQLAITQDKELYQSYKSYLASKRTTGGAIDTTYTPDYGEFFEIIKQHAVLLDSTNANTRSSSKRLAWSSTRDKKPSKYRANLAELFQDLPGDNSFNSESDDDNISAFAVIWQCDHDDMDVLEAYAAFQQQQRRMPKEGGVRIPRKIYSKLTIKFKKGWNSITG